MAEPKIDITKEGAVTITAEEGAKIYYSIDNTKPSKPYTGYFEVPSGGKECRIKLSQGSLTLKDPRGRVVESVKSSDYKGHYIVKIKPLSKKAEVWSFTVSGSGQHALRFYEPLSGIWADSPDVLPRQK